MIRSSLLTVACVSAASALTALTGAGSAAAATAPAPPAAVGYQVGPVSDVSSGCPGSTGDVSDAADRTRGYAYVAFEGCDHDDGIGFARSTDGGATYAPPIALPGSHGGWDPQLEVAPDGTLYAVFMNTIGSLTYPIVDVSHDGGATFVVERSLAPAQHGNWGDAPYAAVGANGELYVSWSYGPSNREVKSGCAAHFDSCWATSGDVNVVVQISTDQGQTFSPMTVVTPGYPDAGADEGDITVAPDGAVDVLYQDYVTAPHTLKLSDGHEYFTSSHDGGATWSAPVRVGGSAGSITDDEWWNDGSISSDASGDLYATWDTQSRSGGHPTDTGWVSISADGGQTWSAPLQATVDHTAAPHVMEVLGAGPQTAYVGWTSSENPQGWALYLRTLSASANGGAGGWLSAPAQISPAFGKPRGFPGDTFGFSSFSPTSLLLGYGSAPHGSPGHASSVFAAPVSIPGG